MLRRSRNLDNVRSLDVDSPALVARATRLSNLYGVSLGSELARKGAAVGSSCRRRQRRHTSSSVYCRSSAVTPGSASDHDRLGAEAPAPALLRRERRGLRRALEKAGEAATRYTIEVSVGMKAFDGPPLGPRDVRELLLRNFRIKLSVPEATALVAHFTKVMMWQLWFESSKEERGVELLLV